LSYTAQWEQETVLILSDLYYEKKSEVK
jgi:hypothetical protein